MKNTIYGPHIVTVKQYKKIAKRVDNYFDSFIDKDISTDLVYILLFEKNEPPIGGAFNKNASICRIEDYSKKLTTACRRLKTPNDGIHLEYEDWEGMNEMVPYTLYPIKKLIEDAKDMERRSIFNLPHRFYDTTQEKRLRYINGKKCMESTVSEEDLKNILGQLTVQERYKYELGINSLPRYLYHTPCIEMPVLCRITGSDDGAMEKVFATVEDASEALNSFSWIGTINSLKDSGFVLTD